MKTLLTAVALMAAIAVGTFSAFKYGLIDKVKGGAVELVDKAIGKPETGAASEVAAGFVSAPATETVVASAPTIPAEQPQSRNQAASLRPPASPAAPVRPSTPMNPPEQQVTSAFIPAAVAQTSAAGVNPVAPAGGAPMQASTMPVTDVAMSESSLRPVSTAQAMAQMQAMAQQRANEQRLREEQAAAAAAAAAAARANAAVSEDISAMSAPAASPVLSEAKSRIKAIDQILGSDPAEALRRLDDLATLQLQPDDAAEAGYRRGYAARMLRDEAAAEKAWQETAEKFPSLRGGRFSALALADTWHHKYAGIRPQMSFWDDIQMMYSRVLGTDDAPFLPEEVKRQVKEKLNRLNDSLFLGSAPTKLARYHKVEPGELLSGIANKYRVDYESIARINGIDPNRIRAGMDLKLVVGDVDVVVRKNSRDPNKQPTLTWFLDGRWMREYPTCVGDGNKTPAGTYSFTSKERNPSWTNPLNGQLLPNDHPDNILGSRWMAMRGMNTQGLGIHGTTVDDSIPGYTSAGCVRLLNKDVEELFSFGRIGGRVTIVE